MIADTDFRIAYITCGELAEAERIGRALVEERLAACVNLIPGMRSLYWWQGKIDQAQETVLIAKTSVAQQVALIARVTSLHAYTIPCVVFLPISGGHAPYLDWLRTELAVRADPPSGTTSAPPAG